MRIEDEKIAKELKEIARDVKEIRSDLSEISETLEVISKSLDVQSESSKRLDTHIDFVENVYDAVRHPFNRVLNAISSSPLPTLPAITKDGDSDTDVDSVQEEDLVKDLD